MELSNEQELYQAVIIYGGIILVGVMVSIALGFLAVGAYKNLKKSKLQKEIYEQERKNGKPTDGQNP